MEKTLKVFEEELREQIAQEIEKIEPNTNIAEIKMGYIAARNYASAIARGKND